MGDIINLDLDYHHLGAFGELSPLPIDLNNEGPDVSSTVKSEEELTLLNISGNKPVMTTVESALNQNTVNYKENRIETTSHQNIDHLLKVIESQEKQNERMLIQFRLKQVLLDYLKTRQSPKSFPMTDTSNTCALTTANSSPSLLQQQNHSLQGLEADNHMLPLLLENSKNLNGYPLGGQTPPLLTPPISPDIGQQFFLKNCQTNGEQKPSNLPFINLNYNQELMDSQELSESFEKFYSSESEGQTNNYSLNDDEEEEEDYFEDNNRSLFEDTYDYPSTYYNSMNSSANSSFNINPIDVNQTKTNAVKSSNNTTGSNSGNNRGRKISTQSAPESTAQMQKRSAHLSAEFRYRTKLNDKITKLRNIVGPKSQLSKSGVLSRSIDLISKLQKANTKLREENKKIRILLMQACNQLPNNVSQINC